MAHDPTRRMLMTALAGLTLAHVSLASAATGAANVQGNSRILVAYFSRSGNTRVIAGVIHRSLKTDLFEIEPATPYPEDYFQTVEQAKNERAQGTKPTLKNSVGNIERYETVYLGFPIWGASVPPVVQTFLSTHNLAGKLLVPFMTHGGYGKGDSDDILASLAPTARREKPLIVECCQERRTTETVIHWLETIRG
ncbi:flavodoxin [Citrobacter amalonaticus]|uniref:Flavodoxin n=1 Tax=Citrobacter amalonaticus TaxID=35703 RepID=A0A2S4S0V6_CITAM|nr:flavodoxin [Citrobacter amalonaticus]POT58523.1 flavodoxin [Citrobacter amalonaticus]POT75952.1 flavodoxin [Citrobacter amalonaticus]POU67050.1 flavodoxin [Citrobacter amalonaticus]POV05187.1 flavodoxin [Citrobacter amalonaticus]